MPRQKGVDCGACVVLFAEHYCRNEDSLFDKDDVAYLRLSIASDLTQKKISYSSSGSRKRQFLDKENEVANTPIPAKRPLLPRNVLSVIPNPQNSQK